MQIYGVTRDGEIEDLIGTSKRESRTFGKKLLPEGRQGDMHAFHRGGQERRLQNAIRSNGEKITHLKKTSTPETEKGSAGRGTTSRWWDILASY